MLEELIFRLVSCVKRVRQGVVASVFFKERPERKIKCQYEYNA